MTPIKINNIPSYYLIYSDCEYKVVFNWGSKFLLLSIDVPLLVWTGIAGLPT